MNTNEPETRRHWTQASTTKLLRYTLTIILLSLFVLHVTGTVRVDGYAIALLVLAIAPWSLPAMSIALMTIGETLSKANLKSVQLGDVRVERLEEKIERNTQLLDEQRRILDDLIVYSMAYYIYDKLRYLHLGTLDVGTHFREYRYVRDGTMDHDLRYLRDHGYLEMFQIQDLQDGENMVGRLNVTEMGRRFVELKESKLRE
jgi:hypothetical protein